MRSEGFFALLWVVEIYGSPKYPAERYREHAGCVSLSVGFIKPLVLDVWLGVLVHIYDLIVMTYLYAYMTVCFICRRVLVDVV